MCIQILLTGMTDPITVCIIPGIPYGIKRLSVKTTTKYSYNVNSQYLIDYFLQINLLKFYYM